MLRSSNALFAAIALAGLGACAVDAPEDNVRSLDESLVATIDLGPGHSVQVYEPHPGDLVYEETAARGVALADLDLANPEPMAALYQHLRPGAPVPRDIQALAERQRAWVRQPIAASASSIVSASEPGQSAAGAAREAPRDTFSFRNNQCRDVGEKDIDSGVVTVTWSHCWIEHTGGSWASNHGLHAAQSVIYSYRGTVTQKVSFDDGDGWLIRTDRDVNEGEQKRIWRVWSSREFGFKSEVLDASGNGYDHSVFGSSSASSTVYDCYLNGYHCGIGVSTQA